MISDEYLEPHKLNQMSLATDCKIIYVSKWGVR